MDPHTSPAYGSSTSLNLKGFLADSYDSGSELVVTNLLWFLFTVLLVTAPPAQAGLFYTTFQLSRGRYEGARTFFEGFRMYFWMSWRWVLLNLLVLAVIVANIWFYSGFRTQWSVWVMGFFLGLGLIWLMLQTFTGPLLMVQEDRRVLVALRNSAVLFIKKPLACINVFLIVLVLTGLSTLLGVPWLLLTGSLCAYLVQRTLNSLLGQIRSKPKES
jgi:hypothetical protein